MEKIKLTEFAKKNLQQMLQDLPDDNHEKEMIKLALEMDERGEYGNFVELYNSYGDYEPYDSEVKD